MANIDELEQQVAEAKKRLSEMEAELQNAKGGEESPMEDQEQDVTGEEEVPDAPEEQSFADRVEERMSPAEEVMEEEATPQVDKVMVGIKLSEPEGEPSEMSMDPTSPDMTSLYEVVYDEPYDNSDPQSQGRMRMIEQAMAKDARIKAMAKEDPEKFALFMYGMTSGAE
tara:strand:- start:149 stop:655 length:507 start_codon:yes stop_codon:yes gene_type:complete